MEEVHPHLYVGEDKDYERLKTHDGWSFLRCCKEGDGGHRDMLGYHTLGAPHNADYLWADKRKHTALNLIDTADPQMIPPAVLIHGFRFIDARLKAGDKVLVACNAGHSRGPTTALCYLRSIGEYPYSLRGAEKVFKTIYPRYDPGKGMRAFARTHWQDLLRIRY